MYSGSTISGTLVKSISASRLSGNWFIVESDPLPGGTYTARAAQSDAAGNTGYSAALTFTITGGDVTAPTVSLNAVPSPTTDTTPAFAGNGGTATNDASAVTVRVYSGSTVAGSPVATVSGVLNSSGFYSVDSSTLAAGTYTARAEQSDSTGNVGYSATRSFTVSVSGGTAPPPPADTTPPSVALNSVATPTTDTTPSFTGQAGMASGDSSLVTVRVYSGSAVSGSPMQSVSVVKNSAGAYAVDATTLAAGTYTARAEQSDSAGNVGVSAARTFAVHDDGAAAGPGHHRADPLVRRARDDHRHDADVLRSRRPAQR